MPRADRTKRGDPIADTVWVREARSARRRDDSAASPTLSREQIVAAAIALLDAEGATGLSMRRLGAALGSGATSLYWYVANKNELLDLALDEVMAEVATPEAVDGDWRAAVTEYARSLRATVVRHPWLTTVMGMRPNIGPRWTHLSDWILGVLTDAGFTGLDAGHAGSAVSEHVLGAALAEAASQRLLAHAGLSGAQALARMREYFESDAGTYPHLQKWMRENGSHDVDQMRDDTFEFGLQRHLDGLEAWLGRT